MHQFCITCAVLAVSALAIASPAATSLAQERGGGFRRGGALGLLSMSEVQTELSVTEEQRSKLEELRAQRGDRQGLSRDERRQRDEEFAKKVDEALKTILDETQQQRLAELRLQREGARALARPEVAEKLGLDQAQKDQLAKIQADDDATGAAVARPDFRNASQEERDNYFATARERREKTNAALLAVLTEAQKQSFETMQGEKFTFPPPRNRGT